MSPTFRALRNPNYRRYAIGGVVSNTGTWMQRIAQDWLVLQLLGANTAAASTALGITTGLQFLPILLLSPYAGVIADRMAKRRLLLITQSWMGISALLLAGLTLSGLVTPFAVYVLAFCFGIGAAFDAPARQAFVSELVEADDLANAVGLNSASFNLARVIGPAASGALIALLGGGVTASGVVIGLNGLSYLAVIVALLGITVDAPTGRRRDRGRVRDGIRYVLDRPDLLRVLIAVLFVGTFGMNFQLTSALMATQVFDQGSAAYGLLGTALAVGSLTGALVGARRVGRPRPGLVITAGIAFSLIEIGLGLMPSYALFAALAPLLGFSLITMLNAANTTLQLSVDPGLRGRVMALYLLVLMGGTPLGSPLVGWVGAAFGARWTLIGGGLLSLIGVLVAILLTRRALAADGPLPRPVQAAA